MKKYLKEILKTTAKVVLIGGATLIATPVVFGYVATFFNLMLPGCIAGGAVLCAGTYIAAKTFIKDVFAIRERVKKQQREEYVDGQLAEIKKELKKNKKTKAKAQKQAKTMTRTTQKTSGHKIAKKKTGIGKLPAEVYKRQKQNYRGAA